MAQYFTDFSGYTAGVQPSDWTARWVTAGAVWTVESDAGATGGKVLRGSRAAAMTAARSLLSWDAIDADGDRDDVEILYRYRLAGDPGGSNTTAAATGRGSGAAGSETGYQGYGASNFSAQQGVMIGEYLSGSFSINGSAVSAWSINTFYWVRFRLNGTALKIKRWAGDIGDEPGTWDIETTDGSIGAAGWVGAFLFHHNASPVDWDVFGVGTAGDTAPSEEPAGGGGTVPFDPILRHLLGAA